MQASKRQHIEHISLDAQQLTALLTMFPQLWRWVPQLRFVCKHWQTLFLQHLPRDPELGEQDRVLLLRTANLEAPICAWKWVSDQLPLQCFAWDTLMWYGQDAQARRVDQLKNRLNYCARVGATRAFLWLCSLAASPRLPLPRDPAHDEDAEGPTLWITEPTWRNDGPLSGFSALNNPLQLIALAMRTDAAPLLGAVLEQFFTHSKARLTLYPDDYAGRAFPDSHTRVINFAPVINNALLAPYPIHRDGVRVLPLDETPPAAFPRRCIEVMLALERERAQHLASLRGARGALRLHCTVQRGASAPVWQAAPADLYELPTSEDPAFVLRDSREGLLHNFIKLQARIVEQGAALHEFFCLVGVSVGLELKVNPVSTEYPITSLFREFLYSKFFERVLASANTAEELLLVNQLCTGVCYPQEYQSYRLPYKLVQ